MELEEAAFSAHSDAVKPTHVGFPSKSQCGLFYGWSTGFPQEIGNWNERTVCFDQSFTAMALSVTDPDTSHLLIN